MKPFARGQRSRLDALTSSLDLTVGLKIEAPGLSIDFCCFGLDEQGQLSDDRFFVFYNQPASPAQAIEKAAQAGDESFRVRLENLPTTIRRLVFTASVDGAGTMAQIRGGYFRLAEANGAEVMRYEFSGRDFEREGALMLGEIYWKDAWRVWAEGQGFAGDLSALLKHFGGEEVSDSSGPPAQSNQPAPHTPSFGSQSAPPPPLSPPTPMASTSAIPTPPVLAVGAIDGAALQKLIDEAPSGGTVQIGHGEFSGPVVIRRPLTLQGAGGVIWAQSGPVVTVESANVMLRDVEIEVTSPEDAAGEHDDVALLARASTCPALENLRVRGRVIGAGEDGAGKWKLPGALDLGDLAPRAANSFEIEVEVPVQCSLRCSVAGMALEPPTLAPGAHRVRLWAREVPPESFVCGRIEVRAGDIVRTIPFWGRSVQLGTLPAQNRALVS